MEKVCVAVRVRPAANKEENVNGNGTFWKVEDNRISLHRCLGTPVSGVSYAFDHVFDQGCSNYEVYDHLTKDLISAAVDGFNGTAFAYGQTSSGKTYTMNGSENDPGIIHRAVKDIFTKTQLMADREFLIRVSYMEIYNEEINDLLSVESQRLQIHESLERGVFVAGLREEIVNNAEQVLQLLQVGEENRHFGETNMNVRSSRSHTIFRMVIESKRKFAGSEDAQSSDDTIRVSVLNLVDLAGSERIAKTGAGGVRLKEGKHINKSLMVLGNVINKLSEGGKQRAHIPYRDSKLTRILQPALGGNAKTSIICTVAPEEIHVEETKGTLQFASRAKRITNCVQVNEIITDAALLKRQKLEIEALQQKLQGSRAEVLEQEILKLRNEMLKYELEREKLSLELEEERKLQAERDRCIREQQMKIDGLSIRFTSSDSERSTTEENVHVTFKEERSDGRGMCREEDAAFSTPCFKAVPNAFVARRSNYSRQPECSPLPDAFNDFADEDTWMKMNKGFVADLDSLLMTPAANAKSIPVTDERTQEDYKQEILNLQQQLVIVTEERDKLKEDYKQEILNLQQQLMLVTEERDKLKMNHTQQEALNSQLIGQISELRKEAFAMQQIPQRLSESVGNCKDVYNDVLLMLQKNFVADENSSTAKLLSTTREIGSSLLSTLESHFSMSSADRNEISSVNDDSLQETSKPLSQRLNGIISSLVLCDAPELAGKTAHHYQVHDLGREITSWKKKLDEELEVIKGKYTTLEEEMSITKEELKASKKDFIKLESDLKVLKEERNVLLQKVSTTSQRLALANDQKEKAILNFKAESQRRRDLEQDITKFSKAFARRQKSLVSLNTDFQAAFEGFKALNPVPMSKSLGC